MKFRLATYSFLISCTAFSQGILNNGARIVTTGPAQIYIDGNTNGDYTSQAGGRIDPGAGMLWYMEGDWRNNSVNTGFGNDAGTVILNDGAQSIGGTNSTTFYNLTLQGTGTKTQLINTFVGGVTTRTGVFSIGARVYDLNSFTLTVTNPAVTAVTYGAGYVLSETNLAVNPSHMNWYMGTTTGNFVYPFGVAGTQIPFTFNKTTAGSSTVAVSTRATAAANNLPWAGVSNVAAVTDMFSPVIGGDGSVDVVIDRWWDIYAAAPVTANCTFSYRGSENTLTAPYNVGNLGAQHWSGSMWDPPVGSAPAVLAGVGAVTANGLSTFSPWILSSLAAPLPIELVDFTGKCLSNKIALSWITASEKDNDYFTLQRSYDGQNYSTIATINGAGNSTSYKSYNYTDAGVNPGAEKIYYKLLQTDKNKTTNSVKTIVAEPCHTRDNGIAIHNTPDGVIFADILTGEDMVFVVNIYDMLGRKVRSEEIQASKGFYRSIVHTANLGDAYYLMLIQTPTGDYNKAQKVYISGK